MRSCVAKSIRCGKSSCAVAECDRLANERELELDDSALDSAAIAFRYKHDLITAEETERWLEDRGVSLAEFSEYFASPILGALLQRHARSAQIQLSNGGAGRERSFSG